MPRASAAPKILDAAEACLITGGGAFEMRDVTDRAGVSEGLVYHYFKSKSGLLSALVQRFFDRYSAVANQHMDRDIPWTEREQARLSAVIDFLYDDPLAPIMMGGLSRLPEAASVEMKNRREIAERSIHNVHSGMDQGVISTTIVAAIAGPAIIGAMDQVVLHALSQPEPPDRDHVKSEMWRIICAIVGIETQVLSS